MNVKHNHNCSLCNTSKTCFTFTDFNLVFAICRPCYDQLIESLLTYDVVEDDCSFCEQIRTCRVISGFEDSLFFVDLNICGACLNKLQDRIDNY